MDMVTKSTAYVLINHRNLAEFDLICGRIGPDSSTIAVLRQDLRWLASHGESERLRVHQHPQGAQQDPQITPQGPVAEVFEVRIEPVGKV